MEIPCAHSVLCLYLWFCNHRDKHLTEFLRLCIAKSQWTDSNNCNFYGFLFVWSIARFQSTSETEWVTEQVIDEREKKTTVYRFLFVKPTSIDVFVWLHKKCTTILAFSRLLKQTKRGRKKSFMMVVSTVPYRIYLARCSLISEWVRRCSFPRASGNRHLKVIEVSKRKSNFTQTHAIEEHLYYTFAYMHRSNAFFSLSIYISHLPHNVPCAHFVIIFLS